jgi:hypothetical protein
MKKINKRKPRKELPLALNLIIILLFAAVFIFFGICVGFLMNSFLNKSINDIIGNTFLTILAGIIYIILLLILLRNSDSKNIKPVKWYINCILISLTVNLIVPALTIITLEEDNIINYIIGFCMFPLIGIITTPNIVKHVKKDTTRWKSILYKNGNLHTIKKSKDYYKVDTPVQYEKKILSAVYSEQIKNILVVVGIMTFVMVIGIHYMITEHSYTENVIGNLIELKAKKSFGFIFFVMIFFTSFGIPIIAYYISNALKKISVVKKHEYMAYHVIVSRVNNGKIYIYDKNKHYEYKYCTCVGIKEKDINFTPATLVFIPDDVLIFSDDKN